MRLLLAPLLLASLLPATARADAPQAAAVPAHPKTCLVLSGGGARGIAHAGVLKVLERERIPVDCIVGTSMGAVIGSLYAGGLGAEEIDRAIREVDWEGVFVDRFERGPRPPRLKAEDRSFLVQAAIGFRDGRLAFPPGLFQGQRLGLVLRGLHLPVAATDDFDALPIPFRAIATDLETGEAIILGSGDVTRAVRASMAVPGVFPPVEIGTRALVDGGAAKNLPVDTARALGAERVIAVDISTPLLPRDKLDNPLAITDQMVTMLIQRATEQQVALLGPGDLLLQPDLGDLTSTDFAGAVRIGIDAGQAEAERQLPQLRALALSPEAYAAWDARRRTPVRALGPIERVELENRSAMADAAVRAMLSEHPGEPPDRERIEADIARIHATGQFAYVDYQLHRQDDDGDSVLTYLLQGRDWDRTALKLGFRLEDDFDGSSNFQLAARLRRREINELGGEWLLEGQIGKVTLLAAELYQPLEVERAFFVRPRLAVEGRNQPFAGGEEGDIEVRRWSAEARLTVGANLGTWGEATLTPLFRRSRYSLRSRIDTGEPAQYLTTGGIEAGLLVDTLDAPDFPADGWLLDLRHTRYEDGLGSESDSFANRFEAVRAFSLGESRFAARLRGRYANLLAVPEEIAFLGGFQNLSGYSEDALFGRMAALGTLSWYRPMVSFLRYPLYLGASVEAGNVYFDADAISVGNLIFAGSLFVAAESPLGPIYLAYGQAEGGQRSVYFFIGRPF